MTIKEFSLKGPVEKNIQEVNKTEKMELLKERLFQRFTNTVVSYVVHFGNVSDINRNSLIVLKTILSPFTEQSIISDSLGFNLREVNVRNAIEERIIAANFLVNGVGDTLAKICNNQTILTGTESEIFTNFKRIQSVNANGDAINGVKEILRQHFFSTAIKRKDMLQRNAYCGPKFIKKTKAKESPKTNPQNTQVEKSIVKAQLIAGRDGRKVQLNSVLRVLSHIKKNPEEKDLLKIARGVGLSLGFTSYYMENFKLDENNKITLKGEITN